jgi:carbonic anhydrase/acetyltransferase-like protein (isoleucine patch superfamily)
VPIYALGALEPTIHPDAFVHPDAVVIGDVTIGAESSVWPGAVLRGDGFGIVIGARSSVQDNAVVHNTEDIPTVIGDDCTIGHLVHLEGCTIESGCLIGVGAIVLHRVVVHSGAIVAANAVVLNDMVVPAGALALGVPARIREGAADPALITGGSNSYVERTRRFRAELRRID